MSASQSYKEFQRIWKKLQEVIKKKYLLITILACTFSYTVSVKQKQDDVGNLSEYLQHMVDVYHLLQDLSVSEEREAKDNQMSLFT